MRSSLFIALLRGACALPAISQCSLVALAAPTSPSEPLAVLAAQWPIGGSGGWDLLALDAAGSRLFVTRGDRVDVIDTASGRLSGSIAGTAGVHGVAFAPAQQRGYTSNGRANSVTAFNLQSLQILSETAVSGVNPDVILHVARLQRLLTFNGRSHDVTVFDARTMAVLATLPLPGKPELAVSDAAGRVYVNIESTPGQLAVIDLQRLAVSAVWPLAGCDEPTGLAFDAATHRLFSACNNRIMVVTDSRDGHRVAALPIDGSPDCAAFDAQRKLIFISNGEGTLTIAHEDSRNRYAVRQRLVTQPGARTLALDSLSGRVYLVTADFGPTPPATAEQPRPRPAQIPGTFRVLVISLPAVSAR